MVAGALDDAGDDLGELEVGGLQDEVSAFAVAGVALFEHETNGFLWVFGLKKRALAIARGAFENCFGLRDEPDDEAEVTEEVAVFLPQNNAAPGGNDALVAFVVFEITQGFGFEVAEVLFSFGFEDFGDGAFLLRDDPCVGVDERVAEGFGKLATDGRLSCAHESNQYQVL